MVRDPEQNGAMPSPMTWKRRVYRVFDRVVPTVENIAQTIFRLLRPPLEKAGGELAAVTVWETPKTWCEYSE